MTPLLLGVIVLAALVLIATMFVGGIYNELVALRNRFKNAYAQIDVQLKRRYDLIPNPVETAEGYIKHERGTFEAVIAARDVAASANTRVAANPGEPAAMKLLVSAEGALSGALGRLFAPSARTKRCARSNSRNLLSELRLGFAKQPPRSGLKSRLSSRACGFRS